MNDSPFDYPFAAVVGQTHVKKALLYNLIDPRIGGVLLCGEKGTAKSTIVRALAALTHQAVVELPLSITEDRLVGSIDFERAVKEGVRAFDGGVLERANGNLLYVDEVNLLPDSIVSTLLCVAASGKNIVEREGISASHPCHFTLLGTMNPEEGQLRPQFLDRFGLYVDVAGEQDIALRAEIIRRRIAYERDPAAFCDRWQSETDALRDRLTRAGALHDTITVGADIRALAVSCAQKAGCAGNRCELVLVRTAAAAAAWAGRDYITAEDIKEAAFYVLPHRRRETAPPQPDHPDPQEKQEKQEKQEQNQEQNQERQERKQGSDRSPQQALEERGGNDGDEIETPPPDRSPADNALAPEEDRWTEGDEENIHLLSVLPKVPRDRLFRRGSGRRSRTKSGANRGRYAAFTQTPGKASRDLALDATLRAAAPYQKYRNHMNCALSLLSTDLRYKIRENHIGATVVFVVDASGSMGAQERMKAAKEAVLSMLLDSYQKRDKVGLIAFRREGAEILLDITSSVDLAEKKLQALPTGGRTPLAAGLFRAWELLKARRQKDPELLPMLVLVTDGRANCPLWTDDPVEDAIQAARLLRRDHIRAVVVDTEQSFISLHIARRIANELDAVYYRADELRGEELKALVKTRSTLSKL